MEQTRLFTFIACAISSDKGSNPCPLQLTGKLLYNIVGGFPYIDMKQLWVYMYSWCWAFCLPPCPCQPSGSSQCTSPEHLASCIEPELAICFTYGDTHFSFLLFLILFYFKTLQYTFFNAILSNYSTLAFSHRVQKTILYFESILLSHIGSLLPSF